MAWIVQQDGISYIVQQDGTSRLLLNDVVVVAPRAQAFFGRSPVDSGSIEIRGVIRLGIFAALSVVAPTISARTIPTPPPVAGVIYVAPQVTPIQTPIIVTARTLLTDSLLRSSITTGLVVDVVVPPPTVVWAPAPITATNLAIEPVVTAGTITFANVLDAPIVVVVVPPVERSTGTSDSNSASHLRVRRTIARPIAHTWQITFNIPLAACYLGVDWDAEDEALLLLT